ncbi:MAG: heme ABC exporter ATP-binding protein CcmA [Myxococcota bacterium]
MGDPPALEVRDVSRRFGRQWAVRRLSASFESGTLTAVVGHNGAGKSTLLNLLAGAIRPTKGHVRVFGEDLHDHPDRAEMRRRVAWLGHAPFLYPDLTGEENLRFVARLFGRDASREVLAARLEQVGLGTAGRRPVRGYSRGMVQRLGLARILIQGADVWLLDEPSTGLDVAGRALLGEVLGAALRDGKCLVVVTHDMSCLSGHVDRVFTLSRGRLHSLEEEAS